MGNRMPHELLGASVVAFVVKSLGKIVVEVQRLYTYVLCRMRACIHLKSSNRK